MQLSLILIKINWKVINVDLTFLMHNADHIIHWVTVIWAGESNSFEIVYKTCPGTLINKLSLNK